MCVCDPPLDRASILRVFFQTKMKRDGLPGEHGRRHDFPPYNFLRQVAIKYHNRERADDEREGCGDCVPKHAMPLRHRTRPGVKYLFVCHFTCPIRICTTCHRPTIAVGKPITQSIPVSYTHLTLPTNR